LIATGVFVSFARYLGGVVCSRGLGIAAKPKKKLRRPGGFASRVRPCDGGRVFSAGLFGWVLAGMCGISRGGSVASDGGLEDSGSRRSYSCNEADFPVEPWDVDNVPTRLCLIAWCSESRDCGRAFVGKVFGPDPESMESIVCGLTSTWLCGGGVPRESLVGLYARLSRGFGGGIAALGTGSRLADALDGGATPMRLPCRGL